MVKSTYKTRMNIGSRCIHKGCKGLVEENETHMGHRHKYLQCPICDSTYGIDQELEVTYAY